MPLNFPTDVGFLSRTNIRAAWITGAGSRQQLLAIAFAAALGRPFTVVLRAVVTLFTAPFVASMLRLLLFLTGLVDWVYNTT